MEPIFNEAMLDTIDTDLALANNGDRGARQRVYQKHMKWLLHYARYVNAQVALAEAEYDALEEDSVAAPGSPTALAEDAAIAEANENENADETPERSVENVTDESEDATDESDETPETAEAEEGSSDENAEADSEEETVVENEGDPVDNLPTPSDDPSEN